jgi:hypothetical protein
MAGPNEWQQVCNQSNPEKTGRSCEGADFSWLSSKVSRTLPLVPSGTYIFGPRGLMPSGLISNAWVHGSWPTYLETYTHKQTVQRIPLGRGSQLRVFAITF